MVSHVTWASPVPLFVHQDHLPLAKTLTILLRGGIALINSAHFSELETHDLCGMYPGPTNLENDNQLQWQCPQNLLCTLEPKFKLTETASNGVILGTLWQMVLRSPCSLALWTTSNTNSSSGQGNKRMRKHKGQWASVNSRGRTFDQLIPQIHPLPGKYWQVLRGPLNQRPINMSRSSSPTLAITSWPSSKCPCSTAFEVNCWRKSLSSGIFKRFRRARAKRSASTKELMRWEADGWMWRSYRNGHLLEFRVWSPLICKQMAPRPTLRTHPNQLFNEQKMKSATLAISCHRRQSCESLLSYHPEW